MPDLDAAFAWYGEKLDFRYMGSTEQADLTFASLAPTADDGFQRELLVGHGAVDRPPHQGLADSLHQHGWHHVALRVDSVDDAIAERRRRDVDIVADPFDVAELRRRLAFLEDPWGNVIELTQPMTA